MLEVNGRSPGRDTMASSICSSPWPAENPSVSGPEEQELPQRFARAPPCPLGVLPRLRFRSTMQMRFSDKMEEGTARWWLFGKVHRQCFVVGSRGHRLAELEPHGVVRRYLLTCWKLKICRSGWHEEAVFGQHASLCAQTCSCLVGPGVRPEARTSLVSAGPREVVQISPCVPR